MNYPELTRAVEVFKRLRDPESGCPWDLKQTHESLLKYLIEESYEYVQAVENKSTQGMQEELGDVLLQVLLNAQVAKDEGLFDIEDVAKTLADKMINRHPHVFGDVGVESSDEVVANWQKLKVKEKGKKKYHISIDDVYAPALSAANTIGAKSQAVNFDWDKIEDVMAKVDEELIEVKEEIKLDPNSGKTFEEIGDLLFSVAQLARHLKIDPELALKEANKKFVKRINKVEELVLSDGKQMQELTTEKLEEYWSKIKKSN